MDKDNKIIVALDFSSADEAMRLVDQLMPSECRLKVGHELFTRAGPTFVGKLVNRGYSVFLDLKKVCREGLGPLRNGRDVFDCMFAFSDIQILLVEPFDVSTLIF